MPKTYLLGLLGHQIQHSLSPKIHSYWFSLYGIKARYCLYDVEPAAQRGELAQLLDSGIHGLNITAPYKETVFHQVGSPPARLTAVNTLLRQSNGAYQATNTDVLAALDVFKDVHPATEIVILGNGGTARALVEAFYLLNLRAVSIVQRQQKVWPQEYQSLLQFYPWQEVESLLATASIIINTVPNLTIQGEGLAPKVMICDYIYGQPPSKLMQQAHRMGCVLIPGIEFLLRQAQHSFKDWFSVFPEITPELRARIEE